QLSRRWAVGSCDGVKPVPNAQNVARHLPPGLGSDDSLTEQSSYSVTQGDSYRQLYYPARSHVPDRQIASRHQHVLSLHRGTGSVLPLGIPVDTAHERRRDPRPSPSWNGQATSRSSEFPSS